MKNKSLRYTMLRHGGLQTCVMESAPAPRTSLKERRGVLEFGRIV